MKPTPQEVLGRIFEQVELDTINQEVDAMTDEQIAQSLEADGYTQATIDAAFAKQQKMLDDMLADEKRQRRRDAITYTAGLATAAAVALVVRTATTPPGPTIPTGSTAARPPLSEVEELRAQAFEACGRGHWDECLRKLDDAKKLDPRGDAVPDVERARETASKALRP
jgi:hypothetical protein